MSDFNFEKLVKLRRTRLEVGLMNVFKMFRVCDGVDRGKTG